MAEKERERGKVIQVGDNPTLVSVNLKGTRGTTVFYFFPGRQSLQDCPEMGQLLCPGDSRSDTVPSQMQPWRSPGSSRGPSQGITVGELLDYWLGLCSKLRARMYALQITRALAEVFELEGRVGKLRALLGGPADKVDAKHLPGAARVLEGITLNVYSLSKQLQSGVVVEEEVCQVVRSQVDALDRLELEWHLGRAK